MTPYYEHFQTLLDLDFIKSSVTDSMSMNTLEVFHNMCSIKKIKLDGMFDM